MRRSFVVKIQVSFLVKIITVIMKVPCMRLNVVTGAVFIVESSVEKKSEVDLSCMTISQGLSFLFCKTWVIISSCPFLMDHFCKILFIS